MDIEFNKNEDKMKLLISQMETKLSKIYLGGGKGKVDKQHEQGKLTARERIEYLIDKDMILRRRTPETSVRPFSAKEAA